jgi:xanthine dehydrogenase accessory factor
MDNKILRRKLELIDSGKEFAVATLVHATEGSPRKSGARMIIFEDGRTEFTVGGGLLEETTIKKGIDAIKTGENYNLCMELTADKSGMICGGEAQVFIEVFKPESRVYIFGGGHIGLALSKILDVAGLPYTVIDDRKDYADRERFPKASEVKNLPYTEIGKNLNISDDSYCVIITHGHKGDTDVLRVLLNTTVQYIGMIGSKKKVDATLKALADEGLDVADDRIYSPVGLDLGGDTPGKIALAIASEILVVKHSATGKSCREGR